MTRVPPRLTVPAGAIGPHTGRGQPRAVVEGGAEHGGVTVGERSDRSDHVTQMTAQRDLDALDAVMDESPQLPIELVQLDHVIEAPAWNEAIETSWSLRVTDLAVWIPVAAQPVVADAPQPLLRHSPVKRKPA